MTHRPRTILPALVALSAGLLLAACGGPTEEPAQVAVAPAERALVVNALEVETANLVKFWVADRFLYDEHKPVLTKPLLQPPELLARATPDGTGPYVVSDAYVWGLVRTGSDLWFGTVANTLCYAAQDILTQGLPPLPPIEIPGFWKCDFGEVAGHYGDWRAPNLFRYDTAGGGSPVSLNPLDGTADVLRQQAIGFRSAGESGGVVFIAGPALNNGGIILFAFNAATSELIGATKLAEYNNIRSWVNVGNDLYAGVGIANPASTFHGAVLRWTGSKTDPFQFEVVGQLETEAANLTLHGNRIYLTTWPFYNTLNLWEMHGMGVYRSPAITEAGLTNADAGGWTKVWGIEAYDRDFLAGLATGGGAIASFGDRVVWGTMHVPFAATAMGLMASGAFKDGWPTGAIPQENVEQIANLAIGTHRSPAVFQGVESGKAPKFQVTLLYGEKYLPRAGGDNVYRVAPTSGYATGYSPRHGASGLGNFFNAYIWSASVFEGNLWLGTFDWAQLARTGIQTILQDEQVPGSDQLELLQLAAQELLRRTGTIVPHEGADLFRFKSLNAAAVAEDLTGLGNDVNYGIRTMAPGIGAFYLGTANAMNMNPNGGWELIQLKPWPLAQ